ncbi:MAG: fibronectin type III domain-containing protein, partial [Bacteroidales bacterium]|nr:fibronectin type III domain-containing protein [Bacteroidales bacterium]
MAVNAQQDNRSNNEVSCDPISVSPWAETWSIKKWPYYSDTQSGNYNLFAEYENCWFAPDTFIASDGSYSPRLWYNGENHDRHLSFKERNGSEQIKQVVVFPEFQYPIKSLTVSFECCLSAADNNRNVEIGYYDMSTGVYEEISYVYVNTTSFGQFEVVVGNSQYCPQTYDANHRLAIALHDRGNGISCDVRNISVSFPDLCSTPTDLNASDILKTATVSWTGFSDSYNLLYGEAGHPLSRIDNVSNPYTITDLEPETTYQYRVQAANCDGHGGTSDWSEIASFATPSSCFFKPEELTATEISYHSATLSWTGYTDTYNLQYHKVDTEDWTMVIVSNPHTLTGLDHGTQYEFQVQGLNCDGQGGIGEWSESESFTTLSPETLTLYDGLEDSNIIPISSSMIDKNPKNQFIIPADQLEDMEGGSITGLRWYYGQSPHFTPLVDNPTSTTEVGMPAILSLTEVDYNEMTGFVDDSMLDTVYDADAVFVAGAQELTLVFSKPYEYHGGNLLIHFTEKIPYSVDGIL